MRLHKLISCAVLSVGVVSHASAQQPSSEAFVLRNAQLQLSVDFAATRLSGAMTLEMENWTNKPATSVSFLLHRLMEASRVTDGTGAPLQYTQDVLRIVDDPIRQVTQLVVKLPQPVAPGARTVVRIDYAGYLTPYTEIGWLYVKDHIDTTFTIIRSDGLAFPVIGGLSRVANRRLPYPDFTYEAEVRVPSKYVVATGGAQTRTANTDGSITWRYVSGKPAPFMNIAIAPFDTISADGIRVFYFPADSAGAQRLLQSSRAALDTLAGWFGPLRAKANLTITEIPDGWGSQAHIVGGIIQTAAAFRDPAHLTELYHELSHLWNAVDNDYPPPRWNEGLATFLEYLLREHVDGWKGRASVDSFFVARIKRAVAADSSLSSVALIDYGKREMTDASYSVGYGMFAALYGMLGAADFNKIIGGYYQQFTEGGTTRDFVAFAKRTAPRDLSVFFDDWIFTTHWTEILANAGTVHDLAVHYGAKP